MVGCAVVIDGYREDEALGPHIVLLDGPLVPDLVDGTRVHPAEVVVRQLARRMGLVDQEVLPPKQATPRRHEREGEAEALLELVPVAITKPVTLSPTLFQALSFSYI